MATAKKTKAENIEVKGEVLIAEIITEEQLQVLEKGTKETIVALTEELPLKQLAVLNPLLVELMKIKSLEDIKYNPEKEKESVAEYEDANKQISAFIKTAGDAKSAIKKPLDAIGKNVLKVEKDVVAIANEVRETIQGEFEVYLKEKARLAQVKAEKAKEKETAALKALAESEKKSSDMVLKNQIANKIKYEVLEYTSNIVDNAIDEYSLEALQRLSEQLQGSADYNQMLSIHKISFLSGDEELFTQEEKDMLESFYLKKVGSLKKTVDTQIQLKSLEKKIEVDEIKTEAKTNFQESFRSAINSEQETNTSVPTHTTFVPTNDTEELNQLTTPFVADLSDLTSLLEFQKQKLQNERIDLTELYNEARKDPNPDTKSLAKISGVIIMFGKIIDYIDGKVVPTVKK